MPILETPKEAKTIRFGHTPDPDDAYMFYGFASGRVEIPGYKIEHILEDIQQLNKRALKSEIEVTAVSAAMYPYLKRNYWILPVGASVGRNYGPIIAKRAGSHPNGKTIGIPGKNTTAHLLLQLYTEGYTPIEVRFDKIPAALLSGPLDYGLLIHEAQITYASMGLEKILDLGVEWTKETQLPLPLGLDVVRKDLGKSLNLTICEALKKSIQVANENREDAVRYSLKYGRGLQKELGETFVGMYVNKDTLEIGRDGEEALNLLFGKAYEKRLIPNPTSAEILRP